MCFWCIDVTSEILCEVHCAMALLECNMRGSAQGKRVHAGAANTGATCERSELRGAFQKWQVACHGYPLVIYIYKEGSDTRFSG